MHGRGVTDTGIVVPTMRAHFSFSASKVVLSIRRQPHNANTLTAFLGFLILYIASLHIVIHMECIALLQSQ